MKLDFTRHFLSFYKTFPVKILFPVSSEEKAALAVELSFPKPDCRPSNNFCSEEKAALAVELSFLKARMQAK